MEKKAERGQEARGEDEGGGGQKDRGGERKGEREREKERR